MDLTFFKEIVWELSKVFESVGSLTYNRENYIFFQYRHYRRLKICHVLLLKSAVSFIWVFILSLVTFNILFLSLMLYNCAMIPNMILFIMLEFHLSFLVFRFRAFHLSLKRVLYIISDNCLISIIFFWNSNF